jgi:hypothetical protein
VKTLLVALTAAATLAVVAGMPSAAKAAECPEPGTLPAGKYCTGGTAIWANNNNTWCTFCTVHILNRTNNTTSQTPTDGLAQWASSGFIKGDNYTVWLTYTVNFGIGGAACVYQDDQPAGPAGALDVSWNWPNYPNAAPGIFGPKLLGAPSGNLSSCPNWPEGTAKG